MNFSAWSIRNPIAPLLAFALLLFVGIQAFNKLPVTRFPNIDVPLVSIIVTQSGASPWLAHQSSSAASTSARVMPRGLPAI